MLKKNTFLVILLTLTLGCASFEPDTPGRQIKIHQSILTDYVGSSVLEESYKIHDEKHVFSLNDKRILWVGHTEHEKTAYGLKASWYSPDGKLYRKSRCRQITYSHYVTSLPVLRNVDATLQGRWMVKVFDRRGVMVDSKTFYIGEYDKDGHDGGPLVDMPEDYQSADAVVLVREETLELMNDFTMTRNIRKKIKINTEEGKQYAEIYEPYIDAHEKVNIDYAHTILPNGKVLSVREKKTSSRAEYHPNYTSSVFLTMSMPGVEKDAILEYEINFLALKPLSEGLFYKQIYMADILPTNHFVYKIIVPQEMDLNIVNLNSSVKPKIELDSKQGKKIYIWETKDIDDLKIEEQMPAYRDIAPTIIVSNTLNWDKVADWWRDLTKDKYQTNKDITQLSKELSEGANSVQEKIERIYNFVKDEVRYVGYDFGKTIYEPASSGHVLKNKYGDCKNQSVLLKALLNIADIRADIVLVRTSPLGPVNKDVAGVGEFNHAIVVAYDGGEKIYLDPTGQFYQPEILPYHVYGSDALIIKDDGVEFVQLAASKGEENYNKADTVLKIDDDYDINGTIAFEWSGQESGMLKGFLNRMDKEEREKAAIRILKGCYPYAEISSFDFLNEKESGKNLKLNIDFKMTGWLTEAGKLFILRPYGEKISELPEYITQERLYDLREAYRRIDHLTFKFILPDSLKVETLPEKFKLENKFLKSKIEYSSQDNEIFLNYLLEYKSERIPNSKYLEYKKSFEDISKASRKSVVLTE